VAVREERQEKHEVVVVEEWWEKPLVVVEERRRSEHLPDVDELAEDATLLDQCRVGRELELVEAQQLVAPVPREAANVGFLAGKTGSWVPSLSSSASPGSLTEWNRLVGEAGVQVVDLRDLRLQRSDLRLQWSDLRLQWSESLGHRRAKPRWRRGISASTVAVFKALASAAMA